jgi:hypothetical protein
MNSCTVLGDSELLVEETAFRAKRRVNGVDERFLAARNTPLLLSVPCTHSAAASK